MFCAKPREDTEILNGREQFISYRLKKIIIYNT